MGDKELGKGIVFAYENEVRKGPIEYVASFILSAYGLPYRICSYAELEACSDGQALISYGMSLPQHQSREISHVHIQESNFWGKTYLTEGSLPDLPLRDFQDVPVLYWGNSNPGVQSGGNQEGVGTVVPADLIASSFFMLSRYEETVVNEKDRFGRFPVQSSAMGKAGLLHRPIVNEYLELLWKIISTHATGLVARMPWGEKSFAFCLTHDVDRIRLYANPKHIAGTLWRVGAKRRDIRGARHVIGDALGAWLGAKADPYDTFNKLMALEKEFGINATYFFMSGGKTSYDNRYHVSRLSHTLHTLDEAGHEVGLHASFNSYCNADMLRAEKQRLEKVFSKPVSGSRQHYLRWETPITWAALAEVGFDYDATLGYAQHEGFRAGTCYPFHPYDVLADRELPIWEVPLIVMDSTLLGYRGLKSDEAKDAAIKMLAQVKRYRGVFVLLWHNSSLYDLVHPGVSAAFRAIIEEACSGNPLKENITETLMHWEAHVTGEK